MAMMLNKQGPHQRDIDSLLKAVDRIATDFEGPANHEDEWWEIAADWRRAQTGTVYVTVDLDHIGGKNEGFQRVYRFSAHAECYTSHDFSVWSGGGASAKAALPPGYDGMAKHAVADLKKWVEGKIDNA